MQERVPRSTGELLSDALGLLRRDFKVFYLLSLPFCAGDVVLREAGQSAFQVLRTQLADPTNIDTTAVVQSLAAAAGGFGLLMASAVVLQLLSAGIIGMTGAAWHGQPPKLAQAGAVIVSRGASLIASAVLFIIALCVVMGIPAVLIGIAAALDQAILAVVLGIGGVLFLIAALIMLTLRWGLFSQTVVLENRLGTGAFSRSSELMAGRGLPFLEGAKFRLSLLFLITFALSGTLQSLFAVPRLVIAVAVSNWNFADGMPPLASMPWWFIAPFGLLEVATNSLLVPFSSVLMTLFYYDLRVRYEALDLDAPATPR